LHAVVEVKFIDGAFTKQNSSRFATLSANDMFSLAWENVP